MDVFNKVSNNIKKKLTLQDYASLDNVPSSQHNSVPATRQSVTTAQQLTGIDTMSNQVEAPALENRPGAAKIKATYYLTPEDNQLLTDIYIKNLQLGKKIDKSALVAAAIQLLAKKYNV